VNHRAGAGKRIRVLHVIESLGRGGAERQLVDVVSNTDRSCFEHTVCHLRPPEDFAQGIREGGGEVIGLDLVGGRRWLAGAARLGKVVRARRPDLVHTWLYDANVTARLMCLAGKRLPLVTSLQCADYEPETLRAAGWPPLKVGLLRRLDGISARWSGSVFAACSSFVMRSAARHLGIPAGRIRVIYNSVAPDTLRCEPGEAQRLRRDLGLSEDAVVFLNVGRLDPQKGQAVLLRAFRRLMPDAPGARLVLVGDGPLAAELRSLASQLGLGDRVLFLGKRSDVGACLAMADVFVFPSLFEGLPLAPVEGMFAGLPCIGSRIGPLEEVIRDPSEGVLVAPGSDEDLAAAMLALWRDPARRAVLGACGQRAVLGRFHSRVTMPQWEELYRSLARPVGVGRACEVAS
jgi:glycosyltransferase involved in cell wall biosynthesis